MFSVHTALVIFEYITINGHCQFAFEENHMITLVSSFWNAPPPFLMDRGESTIIKGANKADTEIYFGRSTTVHNLLFCFHTLCMSNVTKTFLLVNSSISIKKLLCFVNGRGQKWEQKHTTMNFVEFHDHSPPFIMSTLKLKPDVFKFLPSKSVFEQIRFRDGLVWTVDLTGEIKLRF